jgi:two-component sensor histidine kinase
MIQQTCGRPLCLEAHDRVRTVDIMLREANHRIANSLQAVMAASMAPPGRTCGEAAAARERFTTRISAIAILHRMLSATGDEGLIAFGDYLEDLVANLATLWGGSHTLRMTVHHSNEMVDAEVAVRIGMVVNELVTNSCKYAYPTGCGGEIRVGFSVSDGRFTMIVADDGLGIVAETMKRGMGTRLVAELAKRLEATFTYQRGRPGTIGVLSGPSEALIGTSVEAFRNIRSKVDARDQIIDVVATPMTSSGTGCQSINP